MHRFYLNYPLQKDCFLLPKEISHHINVLRIPNNQNIILFNGDGYEYKTEIIKISKNGIKAKIIDKYLNNKESNIKINLIQSFPKINKFEFIIQKSTELGINNIYPIISEKSNHKISDKIFDKKINRWQNIINSACEQSGRSIIPKIHKLQSLENILNNLPTADINFILTLTKTKNNQISKNIINNINIIIGSESGFSSQEENLIVNNNIIPLNLGLRTLRTETASLASIVYLQTKFGDLQ